ncbi:MAG: helix-turn-helix transcriptional regulator [Bryobacteraceae bacterium]|nr:helix-turn-helix transcriptional regulator [Bryobacteraceae bacterium]
MTTTDREQPDTDAQRLRSDLAAVLLDLDLRPIALDAAAAYLLRLNGRAVLPKEIQAAFRLRRPSRSEPMTVSLRLGAASYVCHAHLLAPAGNGRDGGYIMLHFERESSVEEAARSAAAEFHLTDRECEVLQGIILGLSSKEMASHMGISPNTVKAFVRLVMIKMGVSTRAAIVAKLLEYNGTATTSRTAGQ